MSDLTVQELDNVERHLDKVSCPPDNVFRRMIAEIRRRRKKARK